LLNRGISPVKAEDPEVEPLIARCVKQKKTLVAPYTLNCRIVILPRLEEKDLEAFRIVIEETGHPTAAEFKEHLQLAADISAPGHRVTELPPVKKIRSAGRRPLHAGRVRSRGGRKRARRKLEIRLLRDCC
jgi:hypothetical protein